MSIKKAAKTKVSRARKADSYHHGNLRADLIALTRQTLETTAPEAITLKSLALKLGVSQPAPYRHFADRDSLMAAVAADGFVRFSEALAQARAANRYDDAFVAACRAYVLFGRTNRGVYRLMFASNITARAEEAELREASQKSFDMLLKVVSDMVPPDRVHATALWIWSSLHGLVMLEAEGLGNGPGGRGDACEDVLRQMSDTFKRNV